MLITDEFLKTYLARPEIAPPPEACDAEKALHRKLLDEPRATINLPEISTVADPDARENWHIFLSWRDHLLQHRTLEAAYCALVRQRLAFPPLLVDQIVQVILRNVLDDCDDVFVLRAAELFFRPQKLAVHADSLLATDMETPPPAPLVSLLRLQPEVLNPDNAAVYWDRSDSFDLALDLTAGRDGLNALGNVVSRWIQHLLGIEVEITPLTRVRDVNLTWYVGLDSTATRLGDALWRGAASTQLTPEFIVGLYQLTFPDDTRVIEHLRGEPTYLIVAASTEEMTLRLKPQNLLTGLPLQPTRELNS